MWKVKRECYCDICGTKLIDTTDERGRVYNNDENIVERIKFVHYVSDRSCHELISKEEEKDLCPKCLQRFLAVEERFLKVLDNLFEGKTDEAIWRK